MAVIKNVTSTNNTITLTLSGFTPRDFDRTVDFYWSTDGKTWKKYITKTLAPGDTETFGRKLNLDPGTVYYLKAIMTGTGDPYEYGPFTVKTTGASYTEMTGECTMTPIGATVNVLLQGINPQAGYNRTIKLLHKKVGTDSYVLADTYTIRAESTGTAFAYVIYGLEEKTEYNIKVEAYNHLGGMLKSWSDDIVTGYAMGGTLKVDDLTEKGCSLTASGIPASTKYTRQLTWYGKEGVNGDWELLAKTYTGNGTYVYSENRLYPNTYYGFKVEVSANDELIETLTASCTTPAASGTLKAEDTTEYSTKVLLSGLITGISYVRKIKWYYRTSTETAYTKYSKESTLSQSGSSVAMEIDTLASSTTYSIKAEICDINDKILGAKTLVITTKETVAEVKQGAATSASIKVIVSGMSNASYARDFEWYFKRQDETDYVQFDKTTLPATDETGTIYKVIKPLIAQTWYDFKVRIMKGTACMKELTLSARTALDNEIVPQSEVDRIESEVGNKVVKVFWDAPEHKPGFKYCLQIASDEEEESFADVSEILLSPPEIGYTELELPELDKTYYVRIHAYYEMDGEKASKWSDSIPAWSYARFEWDTPKVEGEMFRVTAAEWNRMIAAIRTRMVNNGILLVDYPCDDALAGKPITALHFNQACVAISTFNMVGLPVQVCGNSITADMLNMLASKINLE